MELILIGRDICLLGCGEQVQEVIELRDLTSREAPVRACFSGTPRNYNFEIKAIDGTANPYLALSAILAAGMLGVKSSSPLIVKSCLGITVLYSPTDARR
jgi:hypothetical protein